METTNQLILQAFTARKPTGLIESRWISSQGVQVSLKLKNTSLVWDDFVYQTDQQIRQHIGEERV